MFEKTEQTPQSEPTAVAVPESELEFSFARSGGKGGQNVNKVETKVVVRWNPDTSKILTPEQKDLIRQYNPLTNRMDKQGNVILYEQSERSQEANRRLVIEKLNRFVAEALNPPAPRIATSVPRYAKEGRLQKKSELARKKERRKKIRPSHPQDW